MPYLNKDDGFPEHPKVDALSDGAYRLHDAGMHYCAKNLSDGAIPLPPNKAPAGPSGTAHGAATTPAKNSTPPTPHSKGASTVTEDSRTRAGRDLTTIARLSDQLLTQAVHAANDPTIPGGNAMVALGHVANQEAWEHQYEARETTGRDVSHVEDEAEESPLQTLAFWSERWRQAHGAEYDMRPTIATEAAFIRWALDWAHQNEPLWDAFVKDMTKARTRLETILYAGIRAERGVPCMYDECRGIRLVRKLQPTRDEDGNKIWEYSNWHCTRCKRVWTADQYAAMVTAAHERTKFEDIDGDTWCSIEYAAKKVQRSPKTVETWMIRGDLPAVCIIAGRRTRFVHLESVRELDEKAAKRNRAG